MRRLKKSVITTAVGLAVIGGSLVTASPAMATKTEISWIQLPTQSRCNVALTSAAKTAVAKGYTNIKSSGCSYLSTRKVWEAWYSYTRP